MSASCPKEQLQFPIQDQTAAKPTMVWLAAVGLVLPRAMVATPHHRPATVLVPVQVDKA